jgi:hypothetical protein
MLTVFLPIVIRTISPEYMKVVITRMCFSQSFFDIMPHLMMHMVDQIQELGPMYLHQMWMYKQFMLTLNRYFLNRAYSEGSMIEAYTTEKAIN